MSNVQRVCVQCGQGNPVESRYCSHCGYDSQAALPAPRSNFPAVIGQAALPVLLGAASLVVRAGWKLLKSRLAQASLSNTGPANGVQPPTVSQPTIPIPRNDAASVRRARRTIHIRSSWAVNNGNGWQQGSSEHTIEVDE